MYVAKEYLGLEVEERPVALTELSDFADVNPTSEVLARTIYRKLSERLNDGVRKVYKVRIGESENSAVTYYED